MLQSWHRECFKCGECTKRLDSVNCCEGPDKDIYCKGIKNNLNFTIITTHPFSLLSLSHMMTSMFIYMYIYFKIQRKQREKLEEREIERGWERGRGERERDTYS